ncbi:MAG: hypothetical protein COB83_13005 [Gammaproteobacteria bacterium]|nr:MAG: hypothetical protein COB83_13005 [Gammaproteobacteria bacterium]
MNELKIWFEQQLHDLGVTKIKLVKRMNYQNTDKGLRRLSEFLEYPSKSTNEFIQQLCPVLNIEFSVLHQKVIQRNKQVKGIRKAFIQLTYPRLDSISPLFHRGWLRGFLREDVPEIVQRLPFNERKKQLKHLYERKLKTLDNSLSSSITGFTYYDT